MFCLLLLRVRGTLLVALGSVLVVARMLDGYGMGGGNEYRWVSMEYAYCRATNQLCPLHPLLDQVKGSLAASSPRPSCHALEGDFRLFVVAVYRAWQLGEARKEAWSGKHRALGRESARTGCYCRCQWYYEYSSLPYALLTRRKQRLSRGLSHVARCGDRMWAHYFRSQSRRLLVRCWQSLPGCAFVVYAVAVGLSECAWDVGLSTESATVSSRVWTWVLELDDSERRAAFCPDWRVWSCAASRVFPHGGDCLQTLCTAVAAIAAARRWL